MVRSENNQGFTTVSMVMNLALIAAVSTGVIAAIASLAG